MAELKTEENQEGNSTFGEISERGSEDDVVTEEPVATGDSEVTETTEETTEEVPVKETEAESPKEEVVLTDKGTKLDPNPESAAHQLAANAKREAQQLKQLLGNKERLAAYMKEAFPAEVEEAPLETYTPEDFENLEDVANVVNKINTNFAEKAKSYQSEIQQLKQQVATLQRGGEVQQIASKIEADVNSLRKEPELVKDSPDYIEGLESDIANLYHKLDFNEETGSYNGKHSIAELGRQMISAARKARQVGSVKAQTVVKDKSAGKVVTSPKVKEEPNADSMNPGDSIALGISKMRF